MRARDHGSAETYLSDDGFTTTDLGGTTPGGILGDPTLARPAREAAAACGAPPPEFIAGFMTCQHDHRTSIAGRASEDFPHGPTCILARYAHA